MGMWSGWNDGRNSERNDVLRFMSNGKIVEHFHQFLCNGFNFLFLTFSIFGIFSVFLAFLENGRSTRRCEDELGQNVFCLYVESK